MQALKDPAPYCRAGGSQPTVHIEDRAYRCFRAGYSRDAIEERDALMLCCRFGEGIRWQCQPWQACRQEAGYPAGLSGADAPPEVHLRLDVHLVDAGTGSVCAHGRVSWPPPFVAAVRAAIDRHLAGPQDNAAAGAEIDELYRRWPKTADMVRDRAVASCRGGVQ